MKTETSSLNGKTDLLKDKTPSPFDFIGITEYVFFVAGCLILAVSLPVIGLIAGTTCIWEAIDRGFRGGLARTGTELSGLLCGRLVPWFNSATHNFNKRLVKREIDSFMVNAGLLLGGLIPVLFFLAFWHHMAYGFSMWVFWGYNVIRLGPFV
jgi:hypothetical protein